MYDGFSQRLTRRLLRPRAIRRALRQAEALFAPFRQPTGFATGRAGRVTELAGFGSNPGQLRMFLYVPDPPPRPGAPLIVVLHGCGQHAATFASAAGWMAQADRIGAPLLLPEQVGENNRGRCFNWFRTADIRRGSGEVASIRQMVKAAHVRLESDQRRVFVVGLSAGGAMAAALLAAYPDIFAAGAVVAGIPVSVATTVASAFSQMTRAAPELPAEALAARARDAGPAHYAGAWPRISLWQGGADQTVVPGNAEALARQWTALHGLPETPSIDIRPAPGVRRRCWGRTVEVWTIAGMGHGFPSILPGEDQFVLQAPVDGAAQIMRFWGL
jgi:poly(hydroxyalkanoate) depolymerase family esterase